MVVLTILDLGSLDITINRKGFKMYIKLNEENQTISYPPVNKDNICNYNIATDLLEADGYIDIDENLIDLFNQGKGKIENNIIVDISQTPEYIASQLEKAKTSTYYNIISKYDQAIKNGVFKIDTEYYGNMYWYDSWTKEVSLYESGLVLSDTFTVRLYKSPTSEDGVYYNYNTTQTLSSFKSMLQTLNSRQFLLYQPIRNNLISQLKLAATIEEVNIIENLIDNSFGDIIDETTTIVQDGE